MLRRRAYLSFVVFRVCTTWQSGGSSEFRIIRPRFGRGT